MKEEKQSGEKCHKCNRELYWSVVVGTNNDMIVSAFCSFCGIGYVKPYKEIKIKDDEYDCLYEKENASKKTP